MKYVLICAFVLVSMMNFAQNCGFSLTGTVRDEHTKNPVPFAKLSIEALNRQALADSLGSFTFSNVCQGQITLRCIPHFGCEPIDITVDIPYNSELIIDVETHIIDLDESEVVAYVFRRESQAGMKLSVNDLSKVKGNTLGEQLMRIPGMSTLSTGSSIVKPVINGMHSNRIVIVNNGIRQEGQQWGSEHAPEIDPNLAGNLEVIQGANGLQYGPDAIGGVILVSPDPLPYGKNHSGWLKLAANSNGRGGMSSALVNGSFKRWSKWAYRIHGTGRINGTQSAPDYLIKNTASNDYSFSGAFGYKGTRLEADVFYSRYTSNLGIFTGSHIGNLTDLNAAFFAEQPKDSGYFTYSIEKPKQFIQHQLSKFNLIYHWNEKVKTAVIVGYQYNLRQEYDLHKAYNDSLAALDLPAFELNLWTTSIDSKTTIQHSRKLKSVVGASYFKQDNAYAGRFFIPNFQKWQGGLYYTGVYESENWQFDYGVRYDLSRLKVYKYEENVLTSPSRDFGNLSSSIGASRVIGHHVIVRANAGTAWRPPSINELYSDGLHHGAAAIEVGDQLLKKELVYNVQAGMQYKSRFAKLDVSLFWNRFDGYINLQPQLPAQLTIVGAFPVFYYQQSDVRIAGLNGVFEIPIRPWISYTIQGNLLVADDLEAKKPVFGIPSNRLTNRIHVGTAFKKSAWSWFAEVEGLNVFEQKRVSENADYVAPPKGYFLLNGSIGLSKKTNGTQSLQLVFEVSNLLNTTYRDYMNRFRYFTDDLGRNWTIKMIVPFSIKNLTKDK
ncbi:MAG: TonB-dependent receptor [Fluviicola sp.]|nr:TonB-dependent receptor [Fluviicola sp.]